MLDVPLKSKTKCIKKGGYNVYVAFRRLIVVVAADAASSEERGGAERVMIRVSMIHPSIVISPVKLGRHFPGRCLSICYNFDQFVFDSFLDGWISCAEPYFDFIEWIMS